jgi:hypothetical protein
LAVDFDAIRGWAAAARAARELRESSYDFDVRLGMTCQATLGGLSPSRFDAAQGGDVATVDNFKGPIFIHTDEISRSWDHQLVGGTNPDVFAVNS